MKPQDKKIFKERIKSFFPQATPSGVEQLMSLLINCCCIDLCSINNADDIQFTSLEVVGNTLSLTLTINGTPVTQSAVLPANIVTTMTNTVVGNLIGTYTNEVGVAVDINETVTIMGTPTLTNNILTIPFTNETGVTSNITVDLSPLATDVSIQGIVYNPTTNTWIITQTDGSTSTITWNDILTDVDFCPAVKACETVTTIVDNGDGTVTFTNEAGIATTINIVDLLVTTVELFTVNAGTTNVSTDNSLGEQTVTVGDILHFWSSNGSINFNVQAGSVVTDFNTESSIIPYTPTFPLTSTNVQDAIDELANNTHVPVTTVDSLTIDFTQSGVNNQTITADLVGANTATIGQIPTSDGSGSITWTTPATVVLADNGLTEVSGTIKLGGTLIEDTTITQAAYNIEFNSVQTDGRTTEIHAGNDVINAGVKGVGFTSEKSGILGYLFTGDATATGGFSNQTSVGLTNFSTENATLTFFENAGSIGGAVSVNSLNGATSFDFSDNGNTNISSNNSSTNNTISTSHTTDIATPEYRISVITPLTTQQVVVSPDNVSMSKYPNTRDDSGISTPINFLYTDPSGIMQSAPTSLLTVSVDNGLTNVGNTIELGGTLIHDTFIDDTTVNTNKLSIGTTTPINSFIVISETENRIATTINDYNAYLRTMSNYNRLEVSSDINPEIARVDTTAVIGQATTNISAYDGTETVQTNYNAQSGNTYATTIVTNGVNTNTLTVTPTSLQSSIHPNTRDDSGITTPINFLYTDTNGTLQSAPTSILNGNNWLLNGNAGTDGGVTDFLGTTDDVPFLMKVNNFPVAKFYNSPYNYSVAFGYGSGSEVYGSNGFVANEANVIYSGDFSAAFNSGNAINSNNTFVCGMTNSTVNSAVGSFLAGMTNIASGSLSFISGVNNRSRSYAETVFGTNSIDYTAINVSNFDPADRLFCIGNGNVATNSFNNALTLWKDGRAVMNTDATNTTPIQNTWFGINGTLAQNYNHIHTDNTLAAFSAEHTPSGNYVILGSNTNNSGLVINNTKQFVFATTTSTNSTNLAATTTIGNYSNSGFLFGGGSVATSTVDVRGTLGLSNTRIDTVNPVLNTNNTVYHFTGGTSGTIDMTAHKVDNRTIVLTNYSGVSLTLSDAVRTGSATTITTLPDNTRIIVAYDGVEFFKIN
jgi:hypothetical protein